MIRNPSSVRPWQHVLEPLSGYLLLGQRLMEEGVRYAEAWNFGPEDRDAKSVEWIVRRFSNLWGEGATYKVQSDNQLHEAAALKLDISKSKNILKWLPRWNLDTALTNTAAWYQAYLKKENMLEVCREQIKQYEQTKG